MTPKTRTAGYVFGQLGKALCYLLLFLLSQVLISAAYTLTAQLYAMLNPDATIDTMELVLACTDQISLFSGAAALIILAAFFLLRRKNPLKQSGFLRTHGRYVFIGLGMAPVFYAAVTLVLSLLPQQWLDAYAEASAALNQDGIIMVLATVVMAPIVEEVIFRGLILSRLRCAMPGWLAVLISSLLFGVCHGQAVWMAYAFVLGMVFGFLALRARSIWPSLVAHLVFNGIGQLMSTLETRGMDAVPIMFLLSGVGGAICVVTAVFMLIRPLGRTSSAT